VGIVTDRMQNQSLNTTGYEIVESSSGALQSLTLKKTCGDVHRLPVSSSLCVLNYLQSMLYNISPLDIDINNDTITICQKLMKSH
jgi:hypothetical protein